MILVDIMLSLAMCSSFPVSVLSMEIPSSGPQSLRSELDSFDDKDTASLPTIPGGVTLSAIENLTWAMMKFQ